MSFHDQPIPAKAGVGLKPEHYDHILDQPEQVAWFEVHPENYFGHGGIPHQALTSIRTDYPLSMHGVGMSLGSADGLDLAHLKTLKSLLDRYQPALFSEHLSWSRYQQYYSNDLLPIPYTREALSVFKDNVNQAQDFLQRNILIENPSSYFLLKENDYTEWDFLISLCQQTGAHILLDINNLYVSSINHGFDANTYLQALPSQLIQEIHLAGHTEEQHDFGRLLIDDHGSEVTSAVWQLYSDAVDSIGPKPTLIEWDTNIPEWQILVNEANKANAILKANEEVTA